MTCTQKKTLGDLYRATADSIWSNAKDGEKSARMVRDVLDDSYGSGSGVWRSVLLHKHLALLYPESNHRIAETLRRQGKSPATVNRYLASLMRMLSHGVDLGWIESKPKWKALKEGRKERHVLTVEQERGFFRAMLFPHDAYFNILINTALRPNELFDTEGIRWSDTSIILLDSKNGDQREVPLGAASKLCLREVRENHPGLGYREFLTNFNLVKDQLGLPQVQPYSLRHTAITRMIRAGIPLPVVQKWAGHRSINTTLTYVHLDGSDLERAAAALRDYNLKQSQS